MIGTVPLRIQDQFSRFKKTPIERSTSFLPSNDVEMIYLFSGVYVYATSPSFDAYPFGTVHAPESGIERKKDALIKVLGSKPNYIIYKRPDNP